MIFLPFWIYFRINMSLLSLCFLVQLIEKIYEDNYLGLIRIKNKEDFVFEGINYQHLKMKSALIAMWLCQLLGEILMALALTGVVNQCLTWVFLSEFPGKE